MMSELLLDDNHHYTLDGKSLDGLTSTISEAGLIRNSGSKYMESGSAIHKITELWDLGIIDKYEIDPGGLPYLESWKQFRKDQGYEPVEIEYPTYHPELLVGCKIDRLPGPLDIKGGGPEPWHILQIAFQWATLICHGLHDYTWKPMDVYLDPDGGPPRVKAYKTSELKEAYKVYCSMLHFLRWRRSVGIK
jgi:hypothetical protein